MDQPAASVASPEASPMRRAAPGLATGLVALLAAFVALPAIRGVPFGLLALNAALIWGGYTLAKLAIDRWPAPALWVPALASWIGVGMLVRQAALPGVWWTTWVAEVLATVLAVGLVALLARAGATARVALLATLAAGLLAAGALLGWLAVRSQTPGARTVAGLALLAAAACVALQAVAARAATRPALRALAGPAALAVTASQLIDGFVTYLAVVDPLGLLQHPVTEQMVVSDWLLRTTGFGYVVVKGAIAVVAVAAMERGWTGHEPPPAQRATLYLLVAVLGLGPGLFSMTNLLA